MGSRILNDEGKERSVGEQRMDGENEDPVLYCHSTV